MQECERNDQEEDERLLSRVLVVLAAAVVGASDPTRWRLLFDVVYQML